MTERSKDPLDPFVRHRVFPEAEHVFTFAPVAIEEALRDGIVVLDTNALLVPYSAGPASIKQIKRTYTQLAKDRRLKVPGQAAREFAIHRAEKFKVLYQQLSRKRSLALSASEYPLLEGIKEYTDLLKLEKQLVDHLKDYRGALTAVLQRVREWKWDDPVSKLYRELFTGDVIVDPPLDRDATLKESDYRYAHKLPPGYKDAANDFSGVGDLLIWQSILALGREAKRHVVFVSGDEKTDWLYQSENDSLYPRYELLDEFRRASEGKTFHIISLASLLEQTGASKAVVEQVRHEESTQLTQEKDNAQWQNDFAFRAEQAVLRWLYDRYPGSEISVRGHGFDFIVAGPRGPIAYEVKSLMRPALPRPALEKWLTIISSRKADFAEVGLVVVCHEQRLVRSVERILDGLSKRPRIKTIVCGVLADDGSFAARASYTYSPSTQFKLGS